MLALIALGLVCFAHLPRDNRQIMPRDPRFYSSQHPEWLVHWRQSGASSMFQVILFWICLSYAFFGPGSGGFSTKSI
jgi:hypothetical protein